MNTLLFLQSYLCLYFKKFNYHIEPLQRQFFENDKEPNRNILYYGFFTTSVNVDNQYTKSTFIANIYNPVFFTNINNLSVIENHQFIGWQIVFSQPIFSFSQLLPFSQITAYNHETGFLNFNLLKPVSKVNLIYSNDGFDTQSVQYGVNSISPLFLGGFVQAGYKFILQNGDNLDEYSEIFDAPLIMGGE